MRSRRGRCGRCGTPVPAAGPPWPSASSRGRAVAAVVLVLPVRVRDSIRRPSRGGGGRRPRPGARREPAVAKLGRGVDTGGRPAAAVGRGGPLEHQGSSRPGRGDVLGLVRGAAAPTAAERDGRGVPPCRTSRWPRGRRPPSVRASPPGWPPASRSAASPRRTRETSQLVQEMWPPALPSGGWPTLTDGVLDTLAMAILAMAVAVVISVVVGPWATRPRPAWADSG